MEKISKMWAGLLIVFLLFSGIARGEVRNIYVGDLIILEICTDNYTIGELKNIFSDFEIVSYKELETGCELTLRTFEPGEHSIILGDKELVIMVSSALEDIKRDDIFPGESEPLESSYQVFPVYIFFALIILFIIMMIFLFWNFIKNKRKKQEPPYQSLLGKLESIGTDIDNFFVELTFIFKEYIEKRLEFLIRGKTTEEIIAEIRGIERLEEKIAEIREWLLLADYYKYTGTEASIEIKERQIADLKRLAAEIEELIQEKEG